MFLTRRLCIRNFILVQWNMKNKKIFKFSQVLNVLFVLRCASIGIIHWVKISNSMRGRWVDRLNSRRKECRDMLCNALALVINFGFI